MCSQLFTACCLALSITFSHVTSADDDLFFVERAVQQDVTTAHVGSDAILECEAAGTPQPTITWQFHKSLPKQVRNFPTGIQK